MMNDTIPDGTVLSLRQLNRALLARQHLLDRSPVSASEMIQHLVGMQSQAPNDPFVGLWTRLRDFEPDMLSTLMLERATVRGSLQRGTIHLVTADDYLTLRPVMQRIHEHWLTTTAMGKQVDPEHLPAILAAAHEILSVSPLTTKELGQRLSGIHPGTPARGLAAAARFCLPLVQTTPRGTWGGSQQPTWALAEQWIGQTIAEDTMPDTMVLRYLAAFGPATIADIQAWSGLTGIRVAIDRLRTQHRVFRNEQGQELVDVPHAPLPDPAVPAPVRFLPGFDNALLAYKDRTRIISGERRKAISARNGLFDATYLVDGFVAGTWRIDTTKDRSILTLTPFEPHSPRTQEDLEDEGERLLGFLKGAGEYCVRFETRAG